MSTDVPFPSCKGIRDGVFGSYRVATVAVEILLGAGGFDMDRGVELTMLSRSSLLQGGSNIKWD